MLDALSALGLAANIVQFVDFGWELLSATRELYNGTADTSKANAELERMISSLRDLTDGITSHLAHTPSIHSPAEIKVRALATECRQICDEIAAVLDTLRMPAQGRSRRYAAFRKALKTSKQTSHINKMLGRLFSFQLALNTALLLLARCAMPTNAFADVMYCVLTVDSDENSSAMQMIASLSRSAVDMGVSSAEQLKLAKADLSFLAMQQHSTLVRLCQTTDAHNPANASTLAELQVFCKNLLAKLEHLCSRAKAMDASLRLLRTLQYSQIFERYAQIPESYGETSRWILDRSNSLFHRWLTGNDSIFWINGKAGSVKSTLMRFIAGNPETARLLHEADPATPATIAAFYFWACGTEMQRTQEGLLRSLLFQLLSKCPDLVPAVVTTVGPTMGPCPQLPWTRLQLTQALTRVIQSAESADSARRFCFFIDGLDEYSGDHSELISDLNNLAKSPYIKLCVSSRPWNAFRDAYGRKLDAYMVLELSTQQDIRMYVDGVLRNDRRFLALAQRDKDASQLAQQIQVRSQGVFLWVFLVARSLLRGLTERDNLHTLKLRLDELPVELEEMFDRVLDTVDPVYKTQQAQLLLLMTHSTLPLLTLSVWHLRQAADESETKHSVNDHCCHWASRQVAAAQEEACFVINSWCRDLLEPGGSSRVSLVSKGNASLLKQISSSTVTYLHRTVADYLATGDVQTRLRQAAGPDFEACLTLCHLSLECVAILPCHPKDKGADHDILGATMTLMHHVRELEVHGSKAPISMFRKLEGVARPFGTLDRHWSCAAFARSTHRPTDLVAYTIAHRVTSRIDAVMQQVVAACSARLFRTCTSLT